MSKADEKEILKELLKQSQADTKIWKTLYEGLKKDFEDIECKVIIHNKLFTGWVIANDLGIVSEQEYPRFISLNQIANYVETNKIGSCIVIAESPLSGAIYRYNNYNKKEWQLVGTMLGYA